MRERREMSGRGREADDTRENLSKKNENERSKRSEEGFMVPREVERDGLRGEWCREKKI